MRPHHAAAFDALPETTRRLIFRGLGLPTSAPPTAETLARRGHCQADAVLLLLLVGMIPEAELLVGRPMTVCPPAMPPRLPARAAPRTRLGDDRRVRWVTPDNPWSTAAARARHDVVRVGRTVAELLARGFHHRDLRRYVRKGWIQLEQGGPR